MSGWRTKPWRRRDKSCQAPKRIREGLRLSPNEERYILAETLTGQVYAVPSATRIKGPIDVAKVIEVLQATCDAHEARRTGYEAGPDGTFTKYIHDRSTVDLVQLDMPGASDEEILAAVNRYGMKKGDLSPGQLQRFTLIRLGEDDHVFSLALHHATSDAMTLQAFGLELYARLLDYPVPEAPVQYGDVWNFDWKASDAYREAEAFWLEKMAGVGEVASWPADVAAVEGQVEVRPGDSIVLSPERRARTQAAAAKIGVTHFSYIYAVYQVLLARMTGSQTVCTTFQSAGRRAFANAAGAQGVFSNALMLAGRIDESESIAAVATRMRAEVKQAIAHEIYPYHHLIRSTGIRARYAINWMPQSKPITFENLELISMGLDQNQDDDDLNLRFITYGDEVRLAFYYNPRLFSPERVSAAARQLADLADALAEDVTRPIAETPSYGLAPHGLLPDVAAPLPEGGQETVFARFLDRARAAPEDLAVAQGAQRLTYGELEARSRALAAHLKRNGIGAGDHVAILAERGPELVGSMLAVARLGAVFVVLDSAYPEPRLAQFVAAARPRAIVRAGGEALHPLAERLALEAGAKVFSSLADPAPAGDEGLDQARPEDPAYLLFTSGSTGQPKCVACSHQPLTHFVDWQARTFDLAASDRFTLLSGLSHDPLLRDVFTPLSIGAAIVIPDADTVARPGALCAWLAKSGATVTHLTPAMGQLLAAEAARVRRLPALRHIFWGGDFVRPPVVDALRGLAPQAAQASFYGSTETPQAVGVYRIEGELTHSAAPVGRAVEGFQLLIVDADRRPLGVGELGEIAVRSAFLPLGYVENGRIVQPTDRGLDAAGRDTIHYTGDRGLYLPDGSVWMVGRADDQVKIRGHRVHLSEVTAALAARPGVRKAIALPVGEGDDLGIAAFVSGPRPSAAAESDLKLSLAARLPAYMIPQQLRWVDDMPMLPNGKIDRAALLQLLDDTPAESPATSDGRPRNATERALIEKWSAVLGVPGVTRASTFEKLGGDSLSYVQIYLATEAIIGPVPTGWHNLAIADLAASVRPLSKAWSEIDTPILIRALAIVLVVVGHYQLLRYGGGATGILLLVSGFMFSLPLSEAFNSRTAAPILRTVRNILLPTALLGMAIWLYRFPDPSPDPSILFFAADLVDYDKLQSHRDMYLWYVHCLLHMMLLFYLGVLAVKAAGFRMGRDAFLWIVFALGCAGRFLLPGMLDPEFFAWSHAPRAMIHFLPTSNISTLALGALIAGARGQPARRLMGTVIVVYAGLSAWLYGPPQAVFLLAGGALLLALPRFTLPRRLAPAAFAVAGASLWIYLTHLLLREALRSLPMQGLEAPGALLAVIGGVGLWHVWNRLVQQTNRLLRRPVEPADATI